MRLLGFNPPNLNFSQVKAVPEDWWMTFDLSNSYGSQVRPSFLYGFKARSSENPLKPESEQK